MKLKRITDGTFQLLAITQDELSMLFHPHNITGFSENLPDEMRKASESIFECLSDTEAYVDSKYNMKVVEAMKNI